MRATSMSMFHGTMLVCGSLLFLVRELPLSYELCILMLYAACIPAISVGAVGMNENQTCWLLGDYVWFFWSFWYGFVGFALIGVVALVLKLNTQSQQTDMVSCSC